LFGSVIVVYFMMLTDFTNRISVLINWTIAGHALQEHSRESGAALPMLMTARRDGTTP
jgi:hypothetical protein